MFLANEYDCNVFEECQVELIIRYHKEYNISDQKKVIHRFLPQEMNALLIWNAWLIRSTWNALQHINNDGKFCRQWNIWHIDVRDRSWAFTRMSREMKRISEKRLDERLTLQSWRNISIVISRRYLKEEKKRFELDEKDLNDETQKDDIEDLQTGHSTHIASMMYVRNIRERDEEMTKRRQQYRKVSESWHRLWKFQIPNANVHTKSKREQAKQEKRTKSKRRKRQRELETTNLRMKLRQMMRNKQAKFRKLQKVVLEVIFADHARILAVMPIGKGKSVLFMLPMFCESGDVIIVSSQAERTDARSEY